MHIPPTDVTSWRLVDPKLMLRRLQKEVPRPRVGTWIIHKDISPLDLYVYLRARFGAPNGFAMTLKRPSSDNLIHWNWTLQSGESVIDLLGYQLQVLAAIDDTADPSPEELSLFVAGLKADFASHTEAMGAVKKSLEKWVVFTNPYHRLRRVVDDMAQRLRALNIDDRALPGLPTTPEQLEEFRVEWSARQSAYTEALGYGLALRMLAPVLAESFVNLVIFLLAKPELKNDERLYKNALRQEIDVRVKTLHLTCQGFEKQVDATADTFKAFHSMMNGRNDFLHGNVDPLQLKYETVYFEGTIPLFTQFKNISELSLVKSLTHVEPKTALRDIDVANAFITLVLEAMGSNVRTTVEAFMNTPDPGWREDKKRPGILFPQTVIHTVLGPRSEGNS
jgi:hypothetical protein